MNSFYKLSIGLSLLLLQNNYCFAETCWGQRIRNQRLNTTLNFQQTVTVDTFCTRTASEGLNSKYYEIEFIEYPKDTFEFVSMNGDFLFRANKVGSFLIRYRIRAEIKGKQGYLNRVMSLNVVQNSF